MTLLEFWAPYSASSRIGCRLNVGTVLVRGGLIAVFPLQEDEGHLLFFLATKGIFSNLPQSLAQPSFRQQATQPNNRSRTTTSKSTTPTLPLEPTTLIPHPSLPPSTKGMSRMAGGIRSLVRVSTGDLVMRTNGRPCKRRIWFI